MVCGARLYNILLYLHPSSAWCSTVDESRANVLQSAWRARRCPRIGTWTARPLAPAQIFGLDNQFRPGSTRRPSSALKILQKSALIYNNGKFFDMILFPCIKRELWTIYDSIKKTVLETYNFGNERGKYIITQSIMAGIKLFRVASDDCWVVELLNQLTTRWCSCWIGWLSDCWVVYLLDELTPCGSATGLAEC